MMNDGSRVPVGSRRRGARRSNTFESSLEYMIILATGIRAPDDAGILRGVRNECGHTISTRSTTHLYSSRVTTVHSSVGVFIGNECTNDTMVREIHCMKYNNSLRCGRQKVGGHKRGIAK